MSQPQSQRLRDLQDDMHELYVDAKNDENAMLQEKLAKSIAALTKQIKEQETYEREFISRKEVIRVGQVVGTEFAKLAKQAFGESAVPVLVDLAVQIELIAEAQI